MTVCTKCNGELKIKPGEKHLWCPTCRFEYPQIKSEKKAEPTNSGWLKAGY